MAGSRFFVGIGAQRSGTTWLSHYLRSIRAVQFSPVKEVNFFDSAHVPSRRLALRRPLPRRLALRGLARYGAARPFSGAILCRHFAGIWRLRERSYRAYLDELLRHGDVAGEISPSYALLGAEGIARVEAVLERPRYLYLVRNPVDRLLSQYSFSTTRPGMRPPEEGRDMADTLLRLAAREAYSDYAGCLARYRAAVDPARLHVAFYEDLFDPETAQATCDAICAHLGVAPAPARLDREVNRAPPFEADPGLRRHLARALRQHYAYLRDHHPAPLPASWRRDLELA